jgi:hypothetical protein
VIQRIQKYTAWLLLACTIAYLVSGLGITHFRIITPLTFSLLDKAASLRLHALLIYVFVPLLIIHTACAIHKMLFGNRKENGS